MSEASAPPKTHEIVSDDGSIELKSVHITGDYTHRVEVEETFPDTITDPSEITKVIFQDAGARGPQVDYEELRFWLNDVSPRDTLGSIAASSRYAGMIGALGYKVDKQTEHSEGQTSVKKVMEYPSVNRLNDFTHEVFGSSEESNPLHFVDNEGGEYSPEDFLRAFAERGQVLMGTELPYQVHDLSDHALGWMGLDPLVIQVLRERIGLYLERSEAEQKLPRLSEDQVDDHAAYRAFLSPSATVLEETMTSVDAATAEIAQKAIIAREDNRARLAVDLLGCSPWVLVAKEVQLSEDISSLIRGMFSPRPSNTSFARHNSLPPYLLGKPPEDKEATSAEGVFKRYEMADKVGRRIMAAH